MKRTPILAALALAFTLAASTTLSAQITQDGTFSWPRGTTAVYNAAASDKLVVVVSGEHNFSGNLTGNCTAVTYNGQAMVKAAHQDPISAASGGHGQTHSSIWYLDNPGNYPGTGTIVVTFIGNNWVATAIGLSGTQPGVGPVTAVSKSSTATLSTTAYSSTIIAALGMGGQGNTASPLPGISATSPSGAATIGTMKIGSDWAGHAVARVSVAYPSPQTVTFNTAKTDVTTVAAVFHAANPVVPEGPVPTVVDLIPGQSVQLTWANLLPASGSDVWVDVWLGDSPATLQKVVSADPAGLNITTTSFTAPTRGTYHGRIDSYLNGSPTGTPLAGTAFTFEVSDSGLLCETWSGLRPLATVLNLQKEGIAARAPDTSVRVAASGLENLAAPAGVRLCGQFTPETSGAYVFHISGSQNTTLWLSSDASGFHKQRVAWQLEGTGVRQWDKFATQTSAPVELEAGNAYYIEAQVMNSTGIGHLDLGWTPPGAAAPAPIPTDRLTYLAANPADTNANNLPDAWENTTGLAQSGLPGAVTEYGDPDRDGLSNLEEYQINSNPLVAEDLGGVLTRETWTSPGFAGWPINQMTSNPRFYDLPSEMGPVVAVDDALRGSTHYGTRYRGILTAPSTGSYQFWITGNDDAELWLSDGTITPVGENEARTDRFGKRLLARNGSTSPVVYSDWPARYQYDAVPSQRGGPVHLVEGKRYYIEVLHKQGWGNTDDHISLAWQPPGQPRSLLTGTALAADQPHPADENADFLPDNWQTNKGLVTPAYTAVQRGQFGDPDADGLANLLEYQHGTNPLAADTDGDGLSDKDEIFHYRSNPLASSQIATAPPTVWSLAALAAANTTQWRSATGSSIQAKERLAWLDCPITVQEGFAGLHEIRLTGGAVGQTGSAEKLLVEFLLDGQPIGTGILAFSGSGSATVRLVTPWLTEGDHVLRVRILNFRAGIRPRIDSIEIQHIGGLDLDEDGLPDAIGQGLKNANRVTTATATSPVSPACVEALASHAPATSILRRAVGQQTFDSCEVVESINDSIFANVPLAADGATEVAFHFQNGAITETRTIEWTPTNLLAGGETTIRVGDSLKLSAWLDGQPVSGTFSATLDGQTLATDQSSDSPIVQPFSTPGTYTINVTYQACEGAQSAAYTVHVVSATFGQTEPLLLHYRKSFAFPGLPAGLTTEADAALAWHETTAPGQLPRFFSTAITETGPRHVIARIPGSGAIAARGTISGYDVGFADRTDDTAIYDFLPDGTGIYRFTIVATDLPAGFGIKLRTHHQGSTFPNGSRDLILTATDFDTNGIATVEVLYPPGTEPRVCHTAQIVDGSGGTYSGSILFNIPPENRVEILISREKMRVNDDHQKGVNDWDMTQEDIALETDLTLVTLRALNCSTYETASASFGLSNSAALSPQFWEDIGKFIPATMPTGVTLAPMERWFDTFYVEGIAASVIAPDIVWWATITNGADVEARQTVYQLDLDVDSNNNGTIGGEADSDENGTSDGDEEDKIEESTEVSQNGKRIFTEIGKDSDKDGVPDFADGLGLQKFIGEGDSGVCGGDNAKLVELKVELKTPIEPERAEVLFDYGEFASIPREGGDGDIVVVGAGTPESPRTYHLKKTGLRIWAVDAKDRDGTTLDAGKDVTEAAGKFVPPDKTIKWADIARAANKSPTERALVLYLEYATAGSAPGQTREARYGKKTISCREVNSLQSEGIAVDNVNVTLVSVELHDINDHQDQTDDEIVLPRHKPQPIRKHNVAWIDAHTSDENPAPRMPQLELIALGLPAGLSIESKLLVEYQRPYVEKQLEDTVRIPANGSFLPVNGNRWKIHSEEDWQKELDEKGFFGGDAELIYLIKEGVSIEIGPTEILIGIGGENPEDNRCRQYTQAQPGAPWYSYAIEKHESQAYNPGFYNQFWERSGNSTPVNDGVNYEFTPGDPLQVRSTGEEGVGGTGLAQVTGARGNKLVSARREIFWNWQRNVDAFLEILSDKIDEAERFMNNAQPRNPPNPRPDGQRPQSQFDTGALVPVPRDQAHAQVNFSDVVGDRRPEDAVAIKRYNGAESDWCSWASISQANPADDHWQWNYTNHRRINYVEEVCEQLED